MSGFATIPDSGAPLRVVLVGAGAMGRNWLRNIIDSPHAELVGIVDLDLDLARNAAAEHDLSVAVGTNLTPLAAQTRAQAIINVTVPQAHRTVNLEALAAGLPVLCEKPIGPTVSDGLAQAAAAELSGQLLMTSQSRRYYAHLAALKRHIKALGTIGLATTEFFKAPRFGGFREEMSQPLLIDMAIHAFDAARYLLDAEPISVYCESFNPAWSWYTGDAAANAIFELTGNIRYTYTGSWCSPGLETSWNGSWRISGAHGTTIWDGETYPITRTETENPRDVETHPDSTPRLPEEIAGSLAEFIRSLRTGTSPANEIHSNLGSLVMVEAAIKSATVGERVRIDDILSNSYQTALENEQDPAIRAQLQSWEAGFASMVAQSG